MSFVNPESEIYFRSGLAKSAFKSTIYQDFPLDYYLQGINDTSKLLYQLKLFKSKFYQSHDAFLMHYKPYDVVYKSLKKSNQAAPLWNRIIQEAVNNKDFYDLNKITQNSYELMHL